MSLPTRPGDAGARRAPACGGRVAEETRQHYTAITRARKKAILAFFSAETNENGPMRLINSRAIYVMCGEIRLVLRLIDLVAMGWF